MVPSKSEGKEARKRNVREGHGLRVVTRTKLFGTVLEPSCAFGKYPSMDYFSTSAGPAGQPRDALFAARVPYNTNDEVFRHYKALAQFLER